LENVCSLVEAIPCDRWIFSLYKHWLQTFKIMLSSVFKYCVVFKYLYSTPQQPWANIGESLLI